jgi:hypothetical protein
MPKSIPEISVDSQLLIKRLKEVNKGDTVTYEELSKVISGDVRKKDRYAMVRAIHRLLKDERIVFSVVRKQGLKRLEDAEHVGIGSVATDKVRRISRRSAEKMLCADFSKLTNEEKVEYNTHLSVLGALAMVTKTDRIKQVKAAVEVAHEKLPLASTLLAFK